MWCDVILVVTFRGGMDAVKIGRWSIASEGLPLCGMAMLIFVELCPFPSAFVCISIYHWFCLSAHFALILQGLYYLISSILLEPTQSAGHHLESLNGPSFIVLFFVFCLIEFSCFYVFIVYLLLIYNPKRTIMNDYDWYKVQYVPNPLTERDSVCWIWLFDPLRLQVLIIHTAPSLALALIHSTFMFLILPFVRI